MRTEILKSRENIKKSINSIYILIVLFSGSLMHMISQVIEFKGLLGYIYLISVVGVISFGLLSLNKNVLFLYASIIMFVLVNILFRYNPLQTTYLVNMLSFGIFGIVASLCKLDYGKIFKLAFLYSFIWVGFNVIDRFTYSMENPFAFGYLMLPAIFFVYSYIQNIKN